MQNEFDACGKNFKLENLNFPNEPIKSKDRSKIFSKVGMSLHISMQIIYMLVNLLQDKTKISSIEAKHAEVLIKFFQTTLRQKSHSKIPHRTVQSGYYLQGKIMQKKIQKTFRLNQLCIFNKVCRKEVTQDALPMVEPRLDFH